MLMNAGQNMRRKGNINSNRTYNPQNKQPQIPLDVDEVDSALEKFIRQKYDQQLFSSGAPRPAVRHDTGSTRSSDDQPPPLPPKPGKRFGFGLRSVSSALPLGRSRRGVSPPESPDETNDYGRPPSPIRVNKQSRVFGASVGGANGEDLDHKLETLRDMGFPDDRRNASILKGLGGNLEKSIEALVRLGEGSGSDSRSRTPAQPRNIAVSQPLPLAASTQPAGKVNGAQLAHEAFETSNQSTLQPHSASLRAHVGEQVNRSFSPALSQQSDQSVTSSNPFQPRPYNPFETSTAPSSATFQLRKAFDGMHVSQPLFPNATGGYPQTQPHIPAMRTQHSMTPPIPPMPHQEYQNNQQPQQFQRFQPINGSANPFIQSPQQSFQSSNPYASLTSNNATSPTNPFVTAQSSLPQPTTNGYPMQLPQQYAEQSLQQAQQQPYIPQESAQISMNPYLHQQQQLNQGPASYQQHGYYDQSSPQPLQAQPTSHIDKSSILALYDYPQLAPQPLQNINEDVATQSPSTAKSTSPQIPPGFQAKRSTTMPVQVMSGSRNPFQTAAPLNPVAAMTPNPTANGTGMSRHVSQESVDIGGYQNGRHSPDAFASLSARSVR